MEKMPEAIESRRKWNPVVDGQLVPRARKAKGHGVDALRGRKRRHATAASPPRARRPRRAVNDEDSEPDADEE